MLLHRKAIKAIVKQRLQWSYMFCGILGRSFWSNKSSSGPPTPHKTFRNHWISTSGASFSYFLFPSCVISTWVCLRVQWDKSMRKRYFQMMGDTVMMFLFAYRQLLGWVMRCFKHWYNFKTNTQRHWSWHTERTTLTRRDTCTTPTNTMLWRMQTLISWTKWKMSF